MKCLMMKMINKRLRWDELESDVVRCFNSKDEVLGYLRYEQVGKHIHWCWYQYSEVKMSPGCLQEVRDKQKELLKILRSNYNPKGVLFD